MTESFLLNKDLSYLKENHKRITEEIAEAAIKSGKEVAKKLATAML